MAIHAPGKPAADTHAGREEETRAGKRLAGDRLARRPARQEPRLCAQARAQDRRAGRPFLVRSLRQPRLPATARGREGLAQRKASHRRGRHAHGCAHPRRTGAGAFPVHAGPADTGLPARDTGVCERRLRGKIAVRPAALSRGTRAGAVGLSIGLAGKRLITSAGSRARSSPCPRCRRASASPGARPPRAG